MKKVMMLAAMLAMMMVAAAPAIAQDSDQYVAEDQYNTTVSDNTTVTQTQAAELAQDCQTIVTVNNTGTATGGDQYSRGRRQQSDGSGQLRRHHGQP